MSKRFSTSHSNFLFSVYGAYDDITAVDFLAVHVDTEFRREWDTSAVVLDVLESDPESNSEVVYWEMQWPVCILCTIFVSTCKAHMMFEVLNHVVLSFRE